MAALGVKSPQSVRSRTLALIRALLFLLILCPTLALIEGRQAAAQSTLDRIKSRGQVNCGITPKPGFFSIDANGKYRGMDVDFCRAVAVAALGDPKKIGITPLKPKAGFVAIASGKIDVLLGASKNFSDRPKIGLQFTAPTFIEGQGLLVLKRSEIDTLDDMEQKTICTYADSLYELNLREYSKSNGIRLKIFTKWFSLKLSRDQSNFRTRVANAFGERVCDGFSDTLTRLAEIADRTQIPTRILDETLTNEPIGPLVHVNDKQWASVVTGVVNMMAFADQLGWRGPKERFARKSYFDTTPEKAIAQVSALGRDFGLRKDWGLQVIEMMGSYRESFQANLGKQNYYRVALRTSTPSVSGGSRAAGLPLPRSWEAIPIPKTLGPDSISIYVATNRKIDISNQRFRFKFTNTTATKEIRFAKAIVALRQSASEVSDDWFSGIYDFFDSEEAATLGLRDRESNLYSNYSVFLKDLSESLSVLQKIANDPSILIYVHGFQNSFKNSVETIGYLRDNISCNCVPILFSWPTDDGKNYIAQRDKTPDSGTALSHFLEQLRQEFPGVQIHLLAHSLGSAVTIKALNELKKKAGNQGNLAEMVFAAADHSPDDFHTTIKLTVAKHIARRVTSYVSDNDKVFGARKFVTDSPRAGYIENGVIRRTQGLDTIDASDAIGDWKGHSNIFKSPVLLTDFGLVLNGDPMTKRGTLRCYGSYCKIRKFQ